MSITAAIRWRILLPLPIAKAFDLISSDAGRMRFWCEHSETRDNVITLRFPDGEQLRCPILVNEPPRQFVLRYFNQSRLSFHLTALDAQQCELLLEETELDAATRALNEAGWVSVLLALKAATLGVDLRNHDQQRSWAQGFVDN